MFSLNIFWHGTGLFIGATVEAHGPIPRVPASYSFLVTLTPGGAVDAAITPLECTGSPQTGLTSSLRQSRGFNSLVRDHRRR